MSTNLTKQIWTMAVRNLARRPRRSLLSVTAVGLAALTVTCLFALVAGLRSDLESNLKRYSTGDVVIEDKGVAKAGPALSLAVTGLKPLREQLTSVAGVTAVGPRITGAASVFVDGDAVFFSFLGMDFATDPMKLQDFLQPGGTLPADGERQALVSTGLAAKFGLKVGDTVTAVTQTLRGSSNGISFRVTGIVRPGLANYQLPWLFTSLSTAQRFVHLEDGATSVLVSLSSGFRPQAVVASLQGVLEASGRSSVVARAWFESSVSYGLLELTQIIYTFIGLVFAALASTVIVNTMLMVVLERSQEIGMLAALGMDEKSIRNLFLAEGAMLSGLGAAAGTLLGTALSLVLGVTGLDYGEAMKGVQIEVSSVLRPVVEPWLPLEVFVMATAVALLFTLIPVRRLRKLPIVEALRGEV